MLHRAGSSNFFELLHRFIFTFIPMASSEPTASLVERVQGFVSENKSAILIGAAAAIVVGGGAYYASTSSKPRGTGDLEKADRKERKKAGKTGKKKKTLKDKDGPILEEREGKVEVEEAGKRQELTGRAN